MRAIIIACLAVMVPEPTEVPIEFDTSLAPIPNAIKKPNTAVIKTNHEPYALIISIVISYVVVNVVKIRNGLALIQCEIQHVELDRLIHLPIR